MVECVYSCDVRGAVIVHIVSGALVLNVTIAHCVVISTHTCTYTPA